MQVRSQPGALLFGRRTYDDLVGHWLSAPEPNPFTEILTATTKYVVSRDPGRPLPYPNSSLLPGEATDTVADLRQRGEGELVVLGSGELVCALGAAGLVDRIVLTTIPVVLGSGTRLFGDARVPLEVQDTWVSHTGITVASYRLLPRT